MTIMAAKFDSRCNAEYSLDELCDGIRAGDEIVYRKRLYKDREQMISLSEGENSQLVKDSRLASVGHLTCRTEEHERTVIEYITKLLTKHRDEMTATDAERDASIQQSRDDWHREQ